MSFYTGTAEATCAQTIHVIVVMSKLPKLMKIHERLPHWIADPDQERAKIVTLTLKASGFYWDLSGSSLGFVLCYCSNFHVFLSPALDGSGRWRLRAVPHNIHSDLRCHSTAEQRRKSLAGHSLIISTSRFAVSTLQLFFVIHVSSVASAVTCEGVTSL